MHQPNEVSQLRHTLSCKQSYNKTGWQCYRCKIIMFCFLHHHKSLITLSLYSGSTINLCNTEWIVYYTRLIGKYYVIDGSFLAMHDSILTTSTVRIMSFTLSKYSTTHSCPPRTAYVKAETVYWKKDRLLWAQRYTVSINITMQIEQLTLLE